MKDVALPIIGILDWRHSSCVGRYVQDLARSLGLSRSQYISHLQHGGKFTSSFSANTNLWTTEASL